MKILSHFLATVFLVVVHSGRAHPDHAAFHALNQLDWQTVFADSGTEDWREHWFLDGEYATITHDERGMSFCAGPKALDDAHHAVLWTQEDFSGDVKIEYEYTRLDSEIRMVTILYIQATGLGTPGFESDIKTWAHKRKVPKMSTYFRNMNLYHISYAAFGMKNVDPDNDYIRARRYTGQGLRGTELKNEYTHTGLFEPGVPHQITVIKRDREIFMYVENEETELLCHFINENFDPITEGRIGLRHMYTRSARYKNFKISTLE
ncbi:MAG: DUF1961 family protein [Opitutales bacterium]